MLKAMNGKIKTLSTPPQNYLQKRVNSNHGHMYCTKRYPYKWPPSYVTITSLAFHLSFLFNCQSCDSPFQSGHVGSSTLAGACKSSPLRTHRFPKLDVSC